MLSYSISLSWWRILHWMFPLFDRDGGNKISLRWNIPFSHAVCSLANSSLLVWQNSELSEDSDFLKADKVTFGKNTRIPFHPPASGVVCRANVLPEHKRTAQQSLFCQTAESWLWTAAFLSTVSVTWSLISALPSSAISHGRYVPEFPSAKWHSEWLIAALTLESLRGKNTA